MSLTKTVGLVAGTTLALSGAAIASTEANTDAMQEIAKLREEIASIKAQSGENWLTEERAAEIKGLVQDVLADADTRASLQSSGATAGWDNGFFISSADGNFRLNISGGAQIRWTYNYRDGTPANEDDSNWGWSSRFASLSFDGHIVDPSWQYKISFNFFDASGDYAPVYTTAGGDTYGMNGGDAYLNDWWILKDFGGGFYIKAGQFVVPYARERLMSDYSLQFLDRSNSSYVFGLGRSQGLEVGFIADMFRIAGMLNDGMGGASPTQNNGYLPPAASPAVDFGISGRAELKLAGTWRQFEYQQSWKGDEFGLLLGLGGYFQSGRNGLNVAPPGGAPGPFGTDGDNYGFTADVSASFGGWNVIVAGYYQYYDSQWTGLADSSDGLGFSAQVGFMLTEDFELVGRWEYGDISDLGPIVPNNTQNNLTVGANFYFARNRAKWQTDFTYAIDGLDIFAVPANGFYPDAADSDGQIVFRTGFTVNF